MTCLALFSGPVTTLPRESRTGRPFASTCGTPALRKYLLTMMSVASCDHCRGISASFISKTTDPSGLLIRLVRFSYSTVPSASCPGLVNRREIFMGVPLPKVLQNWKHTHTRRDTGFPARANGANPFGGSPRLQFFSSGRRSHGLQARVTENASRTRGCRRRRRRRRGGVSREIDQEPVFARQTAVVDGRLVQEDVVGLGGDDEAVAGVHLAAKGDGGV